MSRISGAAELLRLMILGGELRLDERIVEVHVARKLGIGRSALREVLRRLEGEGLLVADSGGGMHVKGIDERELAATLEVRAALEGLSAGLAARRAKDGQVPPARLRDLEALAEDPEPGLPADRHFHRTVAALGANQPCRDTLSHVWDRIVLAATHGVVRAEQITGAQGDHRDLVAAIAAGDEDEASAVARRHVLSAGPEAPGASRAAPG